MALIISDLDGTLYPVDHNPIQLEENIKAVKVWLEKGHHFAVATGRRKDHLQHLKELLHHDLSFIGSNGSEIVTNGQEIIVDMPCANFIKICAYLDEIGYEGMPTTTIDDTWSFVKREGYPFNDPSFRVNLKDMTAIDYKKINPNARISNIQIFTPAHKRDPLKELLKALNLPVSITTSDFDLVDIGPLDTSKGKAVSTLCKQLNVSLDDVIVIGDSENDISMLEITKNSYCMQHSKENVKKAASHVRDSVASIIYELLEK